MQKRAKITVGIVAGCLAVVLVIGVLVVGTGISSPTGADDVPNIPDNTAESNTRGGYFLDDLSVTENSNEDIGGSSQSNGTGSMNTSGGTASMNPVPSDGQSSTVQETVDQEKRASAENMVSSAFSSKGSFTAMSASSPDEIPQALRNEDNWVYMVATGTDLAALLGGSSRENVQVLDTKLSSNSPSGALYSITYRFTAVPQTVMDASGSMHGTDGQVTALVRVDNTGKVVQYSEDRPEWL